MAPTRGCDGAGAPRPGAASPDQKELLGYVLGLVRYPFGKFILALAIAELPYTVATVYLGAGFIGARSGLVLAIGLALAGLSIGAFYLLRRHLRP